MMYFSVVAFLTFDTGTFAYFWFMEYAIAFLFTLNDL